MNLQEIFQYPFMQQALLAAIVLGLTCALLSCFLVLKGWSLMADAISHAVLPGIVLAHLLNFPLSLGAFAAGSLCAFATGWIERRSSLRSDTLLGIIFSSLFALGLTFSAVGAHLAHILFGNLLGIMPPQKIMIYTNCAAILLVLALKWRDFMLFTFDETQAKLSGLSTRMISAVLLLMIALITVAAMQAVGVVLVVGMLISPGITAQLLAKRFTTMLLIASVTSVITSCAGVVISFRINSEMGATIILCQAAAFLMALFVRHISMHNRILFWKS